MSDEPIQKPPKGLRRATAAWWTSVVTSWALEPHHVRVLSLCARAWDRAEDAREAIEKHGMVYIDRFECPRPRPEIAIERDSRIQFARLLRELDLDGVPAPGTPPPPAIPSNRPGPGGK